MDHWAYSLPKCSAYALFLHHLNHIETGRYYCYINITIQFQSFLYLEQNQQNCSQLIVQLYFHCNYYVHSFKSLCLICYWWECRLALIEEALEGICQDCLVSCLFAIFLFWVSKVSGCQPYSSQDQLYH